MNRLSNSSAKSRLLSQSGQPLLLSDWMRALFIHFEVDPAALEADVPFGLDLHEGKAYVSLVAFTMKRLRPRWGGRLLELCFKPIARHPLLNLRTYVHYNGEAGIYFLTEWIPNRLSVLLGPRTYGLPYRLGRIEYQHHHEEGILHGSVEAVEQFTSAQTQPSRLEYDATICTDNGFHPCSHGSLDAFLLEHYTAFTYQNSKARFFRVWRQSWAQQKVGVSLLADSLLLGISSSFQSAKLVGANYSPGVENVWLGQPHRIERQQKGRRLSRAFFEMP